MLVVDYLYHLAVCLCHRFGVHLQLAAVVGEQSVHLALHVGGLGVDCRAVASLHETLELLGITDIFSSYLLFVLKLDIAPVLVFFPQMASQRQSDATVLAQHVGTVGVAQEHGGLGVVVEVEDVAAVAMVAAAGGVDQPCGVVRLGPRHNFLGLELPPPFVEGHPYHHAGMGAALVDNLLPLAIVVFCRRHATLTVGASVVLIGLPLVAIVAAGHILPHQDT